MGHETSHAKRAHQGWWSGEGLAHLHADFRNKRNPLSATRIVEPSWPATPSGNGNRPRMSHSTSPRMNVAAMAVYHIEHLRLGMQDRAEPA
ncbi:hypothetical protein [Amycolatopsis alkalitolerans]|uniref:Uncharacterized protein n=1 Tax=Amycolatopsis alkalitolerans TaxID=2547244 RepID=A0A5C4M7S1_9PSEU|nr:hypothetical protein [Amycolatopsis alkalitolerans]TNC29497.1 hypothetical protein FG385_00520 [Amycolatopsis alkalitolerans]